MGVMSYEIHGCLHSLFSCCLSWFQTKTNKPTHHWHFVMRIHRWLSVESYFISWRHHDFIVYHIKWYTNTDEVANDFHIVAGILSRLTRKVWNMHAQSVAVLCSIINIVHSYDLITHILQGYFTNFQQSTKKCEPSAWRLGNIVLALCITG